MLFFFEFLIDFLWAFVQIASPAKSRVLSAAAPYSAGVEFVGKIPAVFCIKTEVWEQIVSFGRMI